MTGLVAGEVRKLLTVRTTWVLTVLGWALVALSTSVFVFGEQFTGPFSGTDDQVAAAIQQIGANAMIVLIVAILLVTTEFRHGTMGRTLQLTPSRTRVLIAKLLTGAIYAVAFFVVSVVVVAVIVVIGASAQGVSLWVGPDTMASLWQGPIALVLNAALGVAVGALLRSQVVTITVALLWFFVAENLVNALLPEVGRWLPFQLLNSLFLSDQVRAGAPDGMLLPPEPAVALVAFLGYVLLATAAAATLLRTRDV